jgi:hypothetical protein
VRVCLPQITDDAPLEITWEPWSVEFADDTVATPSDGADQSFFDVPLYPSPGLARRVAEGRCVRGWIVFEVPKGERPVRTGDSAPPAVWTIR